MAPWLIRVGTLFTTYFKNATSNVWEYSQWSRSTYSIVLRHLSISVLHTPLHARGTFWVTQSLASESPEYALLSFTSSANCYLGVPGVLKSKDSKITPYMDPAWQFPTIGQTSSMPRLTTSNSSRQSGQDCKVDKKLGILRRHLNIPFSTLGIS